MILVLIRVMSKNIDSSDTFIGYTLANLFSEPVYSPCRLSSGLDSIER